MSGIWNMNPFASVQDAKHCSYKQRIKDLWWVNFGSFMKPIFAPQADPAHPDYLLITQRDGSQKKEYIANMHTPRWGITDYMIPWARLISAADEAIFGNLKENLALHPTPWRLIARIALLPITLPVFALWAASNIAKAIVSLVLFVAAFPFVSLFHLAMMPSTKKHHKKIQDEIEQERAEATNTQPGGNTPPGPAPRPQPPVAPPNANATGDPDLGPPLPLDSSMWPRQQRDDAHAATQRGTFAEPRRRPASEPARHHAHGMTHTH